MFRSCMVDSPGRPVVNWPVENWSVENWSSEPENWSGLWSLVPGPTTKSSGLVDGVGKFWPKAAGIANKIEDKANSTTNAASAPRMRTRANKFDLGERNLDIGLNTEISTTSPRGCPA